MGVLPERDVPPGFPPFVRLEEALGFVPNLFRAQTLLPRVIEAETEIAEVLLLRNSALTRTQKECILLCVAAANENSYCVTAHCHLLRGLGMPAERVDRILGDYHRADLPAADVALLDFAVKLSLLPTWVGREDTEALRGVGMTDEQVLETVLVTSLTTFLCTLSAGLGVAADFERRPVPQDRPAPARVIATARRRRSPAGTEGGPLLGAPEVAPGTFPPFEFFRDRFGFVPNIFRAQTLRPDVLEAEARIVGTVLLGDDALSRVQKEYILLAVSAHNLNTYCVAVHGEMLRGLGIPEEVADAVAADHRRAGLSPADEALLDFALRLVRRPTAFSRDDIQGLRSQGFTDEQVLEAVVMTGLTSFLNTLQMGLKPVPDFEPRLVFPVEIVNPGEAEGRPIGGPPGPAAGGRDPDADILARVQEGEVDAFEELVRRHHRRIYRTLVGLAGSVEDAEDDVQTVFLKAYTSIGGFHAASRFSTWLTRIAINTGLERLRGRREHVSLDAEDDREEPRRPREVAAWVDDPERVYSREEARGLVERAILTLPRKYRVAVLLRDVERLSTEEAAAALELNTATLKTHLLRGRLMLRERLSPHFARPGPGGPRV